MRIRDALPLLALISALGCLTPPTIIVQCPAPEPRSITDPGALDGDSYFGTLDTAPSEPEVTP
jgi:hypothetical protein